MKNRLGPSILLATILFAPFCREKVAQMTSNVLDIDPAYAKLITLGGLHPKRVELEDKDGVQHGDISKGETVSQVHIYTIDGVTYQLHDFGSEVEIWKALD